MALELDILELDVLELDDTISTQTRRYYHLVNQIISSQTTRTVWTFPVGYRKQVKHYDNGEPHFLTFSCYRRMPLLSRDRTRAWFLDALSEARIRHGFHLWAWVVMPEHVHLLIWPPAEQIDTAPRSTRGKVSGILADIKRPVGQKAMAYLEKQAPDFLEHLTVRNRNRMYRRFWQAGSGYDANVSKVSALRQIVTYIHNNPVRRGLVAHPEDWVWSSAREWSGAPTESPCAIDRSFPLSTA